MHVHVFKEDKLPLNAPNYSAEASTRLLFGDGVPY